MNIHESIMSQRQKERTMKNGIIKGQSDCPANISELRLGIRDFRYSILLVAKYLMILILLYLINNHKLPAPFLQ